MDFYLRKFRLTDKKSTHGDADIDVVIQEFLEGEEDSKGKSASDCRTRWAQRAKTLLGPSEALLLFPVDILLLIAGVELTNEVLLLSRINRVLFALLRFVPTLRVLEERVDTLGVLVDFQARSRLKLVIFTIVLVNFVASVWAGLGKVAGGAPTWLKYAKNGSIAQMSDAHQYLYSVYFIWTTMTTTGFGDISGSNTFEMLWSIVVILLGDFIYGAIIGSFTASRGSEDSAAKHQRKMKALQHSMTRRRISAFVKDRVLAAVNLNFQETQGSLWFRVFAYSTR